MKKKLFILLISLISTSVVSAQCLAELTEESGQIPNSEDNISSTFYFDYKIISNIEFKDKGKIRRLNNITYYVNTTDGSMFFPKETETLFASLDNEHMRFDGAVWLSNRQIVFYGLDIKNNQKRAFTVATHKSSSDLFIMQHLGMLSFFNDQAYPGIIPDEPMHLPSSFQWDGILQGYAGKIYGANTESYLNIYFDKNPTPIKTSFPKVGFLVGIIKDEVFEKCNRLAVFAKIESAKNNYMQEELVSISKEKKQFDATRYKPFGLLKEIMGTSGNGVSNMNQKMMEFQQKMMAIAQQMETLKKKQQECGEGDKICQKHYQKLIDEAKKQGEDLHVQILQSMGVEDMIKKQ